MNQMRGVFTPSHGSNRPGHALRRTIMFAWGQHVSFKRDRPPGNSLEAIDHAYSVGFDGIELDVGVTRDGHLALTHGEPLPHGDGSVSVNQLDAADLSSLTLGEWRGQKVGVPLLVDALRHNGTRGHVLLDSRFSAASLPALEHAVRASGFDARNLSLSVYDAEVAAAAKARLPGITVFVKRYDAIEAIDVRSLDEVASTGCDGLMTFSPMSSDDPVALMAPLKERRLEAIFYVHGSWPGRRVEPPDQSKAALQAMIDAGAFGILTVRHDYFQLATDPAAESPQDSNTPITDFR